MHTYTESTRRNILFAVMLASFLTPFAGSALSAALPDVGRAYGAGPDSLAWILQSFLLGCIVFMLPVGKVTEKAGCRLVFMAGMAVFVISALIAPLQTEYAGFLVSRALQGLGSAMIFATNNSILSLTFPPEKRGFAMGWNISMVFLGSTLGPCVGGLANFYFGWRSIFWIFRSSGFTRSGLFLCLHARSHAPAAHGEGCRLDWHRALRAQHASHHGRPR